MQLNSEGVDAQGVFWRNFGQGPRATLALHCSLGHSGAWRGLSAVVGDDLTLLTCDFPGHGRSAPSPDVLQFSEDAYQSACRGLDQPRDVIGHSFGGVIALRMALEHPEKVRSLTLFEPVLMAAAASIHPDVSARSRSFMEGIGATLATGDAEGAARTFVESWGDGTPWEKQPSQAKQAFAAGIGMVVAQQPMVADDCCGLLSSGRLEALNIPVTVAAGSTSPPVIHAIQKVLVSRLPDAKAFTLDGVGHMGPITHPEVFAGVVRQTLERA